MFIVISFEVIKKSLLDYQAHALRALGLLLADGAPTVKAVTAGICIAKAMNRPLGGALRAAARPWLIVWFGRFGLVSLVW